MLRYQVIDTDCGPFVSLTTDRGLKATVLPRQDDEPIDRMVTRRWPGALPTRRTIGRLRRAVQDYFKGKPVSFEVPIDLTGITEFRQMVLQACRRIPYGQLATYVDLARAAGRPLAARAVGSTMANNPLPLVIPCHRVVRTDGTLGGFSAPDGIAMKRRLLALEGVDAPATLSRRRAG